MSIQQEVDRLTDTRPGRELLNPDYDEKALPLVDFIYRSPARVPFTPSPPETPLR